jgi:hypothetical protein
MYPTMREKNRPFPLVKFFIIAGLLTVAFLIGSAAYFYSTNKPFALEIQQVQQKRPAKFSLGIDVSQTIANDVLVDFKNATIEQLSALTGEQEIFYSISAFGMPGCGDERFFTVVATQAPKDDVTFLWKVDERLRSLSIAHGRQHDAEDIPLTTPLYRFLEDILPANAGGRVIILSDLVNDNRGCGAEDPFPQKAFTDFGTNVKGQVIFYYPTPILYGEFDTPRARQSLLNKQAAFIQRVKALSHAGKVRAFFYHLPDDPADRQAFLNAHLQKSIPETEFQVIWERVSKVAETYIHGFRS